MRRIHTIALHVLPALYFCSILSAFLGYDGPAWLHGNVASALLSIVYFPVFVGVIFLAWSHSTAAYLWTLVVGTAWTYVLVFGTRYVFTQASSLLRRSKPLSITSEK